MRVPDWHRRTLSRIISDLDNRYQKEDQMGSIRMPELIVILVIVIIVFGAGKLPQMGENLGKAIRNFKKAAEKERIDVSPKKLKETEERS